MAKRRRPAFACCAGAAVRLHVALSTAHVSSVRVSPLCSFCSAGYKAGMTHIVRDVEKPGSKLHKKEVRLLPRWKQTRMLHRFCMLLCCVGTGDVGACACCTAASACTIVCMGPALLAPLPAAAASLPGRCEDDANIQTQQD